MSFGAGGTYTQVSGAITAAAGQVIQSAVWNNIHTDLGNALTALGTCLVTPSNPRNILSDNGSLEVWQRAAGGSASIGVIASATGYTADRWYLMTGANQACTVSQQAGLSANSQWSAQVQRNSGQTGAGQLVYGYPLDTDEVIRTRGRKVSLSFEAVAGANWSPADGTLVATFYVGTAAVTRRGSTPFTGETAVLTVTATLTPGGSPAVYGGISSAVVPANALQGEVQFTWTPTGTAGTNDYFSIDDVMLDASLAPAQGFLSGYERLAFQQMLARCRRHYFKSFMYATAPGNSVGLGTGELKGLAGKAGANPEFLWVRWPAGMRVAPSIQLNNPAANNAEVRDETAAADCSSSSYSQVTTEGATINTTGAAGTAVGNLLSVHITADAGI